MKHRAYGFTIVELLIVIVVIAILAAISIVAYNSISNQANDSTVKSDLANAAKRIQMHKVEAADGLYPTSPEFLNASDRLKFTKSSYANVSGAAVYCHSSDRSYFAISAMSKSGEVFAVSSTSPVDQVSNVIVMCNDPNIRRWIHNHAIATADNWVTWIN